jgi:hypothetical protein
MLDGCLSQFSSSAAVFNISTLTKQISASSKLETGLPIIMGGVPPPSTKHQLLWLMEN